MRPRDEKVFFGAWDPDAPVVGVAEQMMKLLPASRDALPAGDFRDWQAIDTWADEIVQVPLPRYGPAALDAPRRPFSHHTGATTVASSSRRANSEERRRAMTHNGFVLIVPLLAWTAVMWPRLPVGAGGTEAVPLPLDIAEQGLRLVVFEGIAVLGRSTAYAIVAVGFTLTHAVHVAVQAGAI